ncbi:alkaline phosphatase family protein [Microlunatus endophyticus]
MLLDTYRALHDGPYWDSTLLIITYDEHGGCFDHVPAQWGATPPDATAGEYGFDFTRFGPRVPTILVSPLIPAGSVSGCRRGRRRSITRRCWRRWNGGSVWIRSPSAMLRRRMSVQR